MHCEARWLGHLWSVGCIARVAHLLLRDVVFALKRGFRASGAARRPMPSPALRPPFQRRREAPVAVLAMVAPAVQRPPF
eukprot:13615574-Alexandrium_andersonii.AAC.1